MNSPASNSSNKSTFHYDSCGMYHPDGTLMVRISAKRARWYVVRNLADWMDDNHKDFKLRFEPNGHGQHHDAFYTQPMDDVCVVCGTTENLTRHHIVPFQFRKLLPVEYKGRNHHDILLVCEDCHEQYERHADKLKEEVLLGYGSLYNKKSKAEFHNGRVKSARMLLDNLKQGSLKAREGASVNIPEERLEHLKKVASMELKELPESWKAQYIEDMMSPKKLHAFFIMWRQHFMDIMAPKFMPEHWTVEHRLECNPARNQRR